MKALVTDTSGFNGPPLLDKLSKEGHDVLAISRTKVINLHLKEFEFEIKFNGRGQDLYEILLKIFRNELLKFS